MAFHRDQMGNNMPLINGHKRFYNFVLRSTVMYAAILRIVKDVDLMFRVLDAVK